MCAAAHEGHQVVLAHAVEADVADQYDLVVFLRKELLQVDAGIVVQAAEQLGIHPCHTARRLSQPLAIRVFAHGGQQLPYGPLQPRQVDLGGRLPVTLVGPAARACFQRGVHDIHYPGKKLVKGCRCRLCFSITAGKCYAEA